VEPLVFPFRPWVRRTCRRAFLGGMGAIAGLAALAWLGRDPSSEALGRALQILAGYAVLFCLSLAKIWWTARAPAAVLDAEALSYQPLHTFTPRRVALADVVLCGLRPGTESLRLLVRVGDRLRELYLNLGLVKGRNELLDELGTALAARGLVPDPGLVGGWRRPGSAPLEPGIPG